MKVDSASSSLAGCLATLALAGCPSQGSGTQTAGTLGAACLPTGGCNAGLSCELDRCVAASACVANTSTCDGDVAVSCGANGEIQSKTQCATIGLTCDHGSCVSRPTDCMVPRLIESRLNQPLPASIAVVFAVDSCDGAAVIGLGASDFVVLEDDTPVSGAESPVVMLERPVEVFVSLVLDDSPSVAASGNLTAAVAAAKTYAGTVLSGGTTQHVRLGVFYFSKTLVQVLPWTNDLAAVQAAIDGLLTTTTGSNTTNLYGAVIDVLDASEAAQNAHKLDTMGGVTTLGQVVLFTDGSDQAALKTLEEAQAAVAASHDDVLAVGVGDEVRPDLLKSLAKNGVYLATSPAQLTDAFANAAGQTAALQRRLYVLGYCSPKLAGSHALTVEMKLGAGRLGPIAFDASEFDSGAGPACSAQAFSDACTGLTCGGLLCGNCGGTACEACSNEAPCIFSLTCDPGSAVCKPLEAVAAGSLVCDADCGPLAQCPGCVIQQDGDKASCACAEPNFAEPTCQECVPPFVGPHCDQCPPNLTGPDCDACASHFTGSTCSQCVGNFAGDNCDTCAGHFAGANCDQCAGNFAGAACDQCKEGFWGPDCDEVDRGQGLCAGLRACVGSCATQECALACVASADSQAEGQAYVTLAQCLQDHECSFQAGGSVSEARAFLACERAECLFEYRTCVGGTSYGSHSCQWVDDCELACGGNDFKCARACYAAGYEQDATERAAYSLCLWSECYGVSDSDAAACFQQAQSGSCAAEVTACLTP